MKLSTRAALFSGLIYPGAGFFLLKKPALGFAFLTPVTLALIYILYYAIQIATTIANNIATGKTALDLPVIKNEISTALGSNVPLSVSLAEWGIVFLWVVSIALCFWMGRQAEQSMPPAQRQAP